MGARAGAPLHFRAGAGAGAPLLWSGPVSTSAYVLKNLFFLKYVPVCAVQPHPVQPPNLWKYALNLSVKLFTSHFDTLITQSSHATHTLHLRKQCNSSHINAFLRRKITSKWRINSTWDFFGRTERYLLRRSSKNVWIVYLFLSLR